MRPARLAAGIIALAAVYVAVARLGLGVDAVGGLAALVWPPTGVALSALVVFGRGLWPGVAIGALLTNLWVGAPLGVAVGIAVGNTLEALLGAFALAHVGGFDRALGSLRSVAALVLFAALGSTVVSATVGTASMLSNGMITSDHTTRAWLAWWVGDMIGDLVVAPLLLTLSKPAPAWTRGRTREFVLLIGLLLATVWLVFGRGEQAVLSPLRQPYLVMPLLIWAAMRFGPRGAALATFLCSAGAIWGTALGQDPLAGGTLHERLLELQGFVSVLSITFLCLGAATVERHVLLEQERVARAESERAVRVRDDFLAVASHELRTPITPLKLQLEGLRHMADKLDERVRERIDRAVRQTERLARLAEGLLDVSRLAAGRLELEPEEVDLNEVVDEVVDDLRDEASRAQSTVRVTRAESAHGRWDRTRVAQAVGNLLSNALKYGKGLPIEIEVRVQARSFQVEVRDAGIGIDPGSHARIFERFERAVPAKEYGGLGLGLYVAREIARAHHGEIRVTSETGHGSTFTLVLPRTNHTPAE